jgi:hypothetical protein
MAEHAPPVPRFRSARLLVAAITVALATSLAHAAPPTLIGDYILTTGSFTNAVTGTQALGSLGVVASTGSTGFVTGTASDAGWFWNGATLPGTGLSVSGLPLNAGGAFANYSIGMRFQFSDVSSYRRLITFADVDTGMYVTNGMFNFYDDGENKGGSISADTFVDFVLTRNGTTNQVTGYVNGVSTPVLQMSDNSGHGRSPSGTLQFFRDNTGGAEFSPAGRISLLRIWNGPLAAADIPMSMVPEPSALALGGLGVAAILFRAWQRRRSGGG